MNSIYYIDSKVIISGLPTTSYEGLLALFCSKLELAQIKYTINLYEEVLENCFCNSRSGQRINTVIEKLQIQPQD